MFKNNLDHYLSSVPDQPTHQGLTRAAESNSLIHQVPLFGGWQTYWQNCDDAWAVAEVNVGEVADKPQNNVGVIVPMLIFYLILVDMLHESPDYC